jgi:predicted transcriptional regulator
MLTPIDRMRSEMVKDSLRRACRNAINTLVAAGIDENEARTAVVDALERTLMEVSNDARADE